MIGTKLYQKKQRVFLFLALYGVLALLGIAYAALTIARGQNPPGAVGFMVVFGAGMCIMTFMKSRKPLVIILEDRIELNQTSRTEYLRYKDIAGTERKDEKRLVVTVREGHANRKTVIWLNYLSKTDAEQLVDFLLKKGWER